ncbi:MAG: sigma-70 family RNA polymerase sigma factor [Proteobacteria bacterium]|nr:sigma-70 family RNA polymerase sigma factor [Pseudomonadota bacterium]
MSGVIAEIEACIPALRRYAAALLRDRQEVDDLVHDCLVRALDQLHTWRQDSNLRAWLFSILHNLFVSRLRKNKVRGTPEPLDNLPDGVAGMPPRQDLHMESRDLMRALDALPVEQRTVLLLVALEDLSYADAARVTGVPIGTVMSRLSRAREKLRESVDGAGKARPVLRRVM